MAFSGVLHDSDRQAIQANTSLEDSKYVKNIEFVVNWINPGLNIPDEIWRGKKLREVKPKPDKMEREYFVSDIDFYKSFVKQPRERKHRGASKKSTRQTSAPQSKCCARPVASSYISTNRVSKTNTTQTVPNSKTKKRKRCPMRIAELAVPTKRQCIETWRHKSEILPGHMVERLKQHVMDQALIANITDALYCFKTGRHQSKKCSSRRLPSQPKCYENLKPSRGMEKKILCVIFAHRVAKILSRQLNITLNSNLQKISDIVSSDIAKLMSKCQCTFRMNHQRYKVIQTEVSDTITIWIASILEDLSDKLLEEELRAKKEIEAQIETMQEFSEQFSAIIDTLKKQENNNIASEELEEEEGPVLDFIDDVVENVMSICEPPQPFKTDSNISGSTHDELLGEESEKTLESIQSDSGGETGDVLTEKHENLTDSDHFRNEIIDIINSISKESDDGRSNESDDTENEGISRVLEKTRNISNEYNEKVSAQANKEHDINGVDLVKAYSENDINDEDNEVNSDKANKENNEVDPTKTDKEHDINDDDNELDSAKANKEQNEVDPTKTDKKHDINEVESANADIGHDINQVDSANVNIKQDINEVEPEQTDKENDTGEKDSAKAEIEHANETEDNNDYLEDTRSNVSEIFTDGIDDGNHDKKVIIPKADMVNPDIPAEQFGMSTTKKTLPSEHKPTQWNSRTNKPSIIFSVPNPDLLSDADESWPTDLIDKPPIKPSTIASKSVTSLGRIIEYQEKRTWSEDIHDKPKKADGDKIFQENDTMKKLHLPTEKHDTESQSNEPLIKESIETDLPTEKYDALSQLNELLIKGSIEASTTDRGFPNSDSKLPKETDIDKTKTDKFIERQTESKESEYQQTESTADSGDEIPKQKSQSLSVDYGWKVQPKTAPSWVISSTWGQDRGEPSEDSIPIEIMPTFVKESELRKWCKNLQDGFSNLDMWSTWISATCKETIFLLKQKEWACGVSTHKQATNWNKLRRNIRKDALLWTKLYQRTNANFKSYKGKYDNIELSAEKSVLNKGFLETILEFEDFSMKLHKMIVAAEYRVTCNCDNSKTNNLNKKYLSCTAK